MPAPKKSPRDLARIDTSGVKPGPLRTALDKAIGRHLKDPVIQALLKDLPPRVKVIKLVTHPREKSWSSSVRLSEGRITIRINPKHKRTRSSPASLFVHELTHQTRTTQKWANAQAIQWRKANPEVWARILAALDNNAHLALQAVVYGFEEPLCDKAANDFARKIGEPVGPISTFADSVNGFISRNR